MWFTKGSWTLRSRFCPDEGDISVFCQLVINDGWRSRRRKGGTRGNRNRKKEDGPLQRRVCAWLVPAVLDRAALGPDAWMSVRRFGGTLQVLLDALRHCVQICPRPVPDLVIATFCFPTARFVLLLNNSNSVRLISYKWFGYFASSMFFFLSVTTSVSLYANRKRFNGTLVPQIRIRVCMYIPECFLSDADFVFWCSQIIRKVICWQTDAFYLVA